MSTSFVRTACPPQGFQQVAGPWRAGGVGDQAYFVAASEGWLSFWQIAGEGGPRCLWQQPTHGTVRELEVVHAEGAGAGAGKEASRAQGWFCQ